MTRVKFVSEKNFEQCNGQKESLTHSIKIGVYPNNAQKELLKRWIDSSQTPHQNNKRYPKYPRHKYNGVKSQFHREHRRKDDGWPNKEGKVTLDSWFTVKISVKNKADCIHVTTIDPGFRTFLTWHSAMEIS
ncbi:2955_t:CDS:2, partial [Cetraspora pellucida]